PSRATSGPACASPANRVPARRARSVNSTTASAPPARASGPGRVWSTPGLVETRFSLDALFWVAVVFHGTAAWRNHGLIILPLLFIEHLSSCAVQLPRQVAGSARQAPARWAWASPRRAPRLAPRVPRAGQG